MAIRVKPNNIAFEVHIEIEKDEVGKRYYICKEVDGVKLWLTKYKKLDKWHGAKAYIREWGNVTAIVSQIFAGEIK